MIADMVRNDLGRVAQPGSVEVQQPFAIEKYPTVFQMTSTVRCRSDAGLAEMMRATFPCASVTGAPKVRTMQIIRELEDTPRGVYTGAVGFWGPGRRGRFNVAIRTAVVDKARGSAEYGVGGGIVWDSDPAGEYAECQAKAALLADRRPAFELLETLRYEPAGGYVLLEEHLARLGRSAEYFDFAMNPQAVRARLMELAATLAAPSRVRLRVERRGTVSLEAAPAPPWCPPRPWRVRLARSPVCSDDVFLYHKTTHRRVYEEAFALRDGCDDVLLWNDRRELTETTLANIVLELDGRRVTPPVASGLLGGVFRADLLRRGEVVEQVCSLEDLARCGRIWAVNSVRGWIDVELVS
jgi:para-aminobenzoate synthetase/4-amino-4-deoxychorismate lyase